MIFKDFHLIYPDRIEKGTLRVDHGIIQRISNDAISDHEDVRDGEFGLYLAPGFIDVHVHGAGGADTMEGTSEAFDTISSSLAKTGTTAFLPTTMTGPADQIRQAVRAAKDSSFRVTGAQILGVHLEGPFISPAAMGAQDPAHARLPSVEAFKSLAAEDEDFITTVTLAPELNGSADLIGYLRAHGINAAMGHTAATCDEALAAIDQGINHATHLYNTMPVFHHRAPGAVGAVFESDITAEIIADGIHVAWSAQRVAFKVKGIDRMLLVTDAMMAAGRGDGHYTLGGQAVTVQNKEARLASGALAGSVLTMDQAVRNVLSHSNLPLYDVIRMATWNPALFCGVGKNKGRIADGYDADLILFDEAIRIEAVYIKGRRVR